MVEWRWLSLINTNGPLLWLFAMGICHDPTDFPDDSEGESNDSCLSPPQKREGNRRVLPWHEATNGWCSQQAGSFAVLLWFRWGFWWRGSGFCGASTSGHCGTRGKKRLPFPSWNGNSNEALRWPPITTTTTSTNSRWGEMSNSRHRASKEHGQHGEHHVLSMFFVSSSKAASSQSICFSMFFSLHFSQRSLSSHPVFARWHSSPSTKRISLPTPWNSLWMTTPRQRLFRGFSCFVLEKKMTLEVEERNYMNGISAYRILQILQKMHVIPRVILHHITYYDIIIIWYIRCICVFVS